MKKSIVILGLCAVVTGSISLSYTNSAQKVENAKNNVDDAKEDLDQANK